VRETTGTTTDEEFRAYVAARRPALLRAAARIAGEDAEDLLQAALAETYLAWERIGSRAAVDGYVRRAMANTHISWWRRRRGLDVHPSGDVPERPVADDAPRCDLRDALGRALRRLPERQRTAVFLRYYEDRPEHEVAALLGVSVGTVKSTVSRAMARLRDDMRDDMRDDAVLGGVRR
jgi:RNA polymerase sigma-70 factor (sigma-E family)